MPKIATDLHNRRRAIAELTAIRHDLLLKLEYTDATTYTRTNLRQLVGFCNSRIAYHQKVAARLQSALQNQQEIGS